MVYTIITVRGSMKINRQEVAHRELVEFENEGELIKMKAQKDAFLIWGHAFLFNEPIMLQGFFVMNSEAEIRQAYVDYQNGKFGVWRE